jgi:shikimate kinase
VGVGAPPRGRAGAGLEKPPRAACYARVPTARLAVAADRPRRLVLLGADTRRAADYPALRCAAQSAGGEQSDRSPLLLLLLASSS